MKKILIFPLSLFILGIISSILAFYYANQLEKGYLFTNESPITSIYDGTYMAVLGNIGDTSHYITIISTDDYHRITTFDVNEHIIKDYYFIINPIDQPFNQSFINIRHDAVKLVIDDMDDYLFEVTLEENHLYNIEFTPTEHHIDEPHISIVLVYLPNNLLNLKNTFEVIAYTLFIFSAVLGLSMTVLYLIRRSND